MYIDVFHNILPLCKNIETCCEIWHNQINIIRANVDVKYKLPNLQQMNIHIFDLKFFNSQQVIQLAIIMIKELSIS